MLGGPVTGLNSDVMHVDELRMIHISSLRYLHHYVNTFKVLKLDDVLRENEPLEK